MSHEESANTTHTFLDKLLISHKALASPKLTVMVPHLLTFSIISFDRDIFGCWYLTASVIGRTIQGSKLKQEKRGFVCGLNLALFRYPNSCYKPSLSCVQFNSITELAVYGCLS